MAPLRVGSGVAAIAAGGSHSLALPDPFESNNTFTQAIAINLGDLVSSTIRSATDVDYFTFRVFDPFTFLAVNLNNLPADYDLYLYWPDETLLASSTQPGTASESLRATAILTGSYYVEVRSAAGAFTGSPYALQVTIEDLPPTPTPTATGSATPAPTSTPTATPTAPAGTPTATVTPRSPVPIELEAGWNMVSVPFVPTEPFRASNLVASMRQQEIEVRHVARWQYGSWQSYLPGFGPDDFELRFGKGYFVRTTGPGTWRP